MDEDKPTGSQEVFSEVSNCLQDTTFSFGHFFDFSRNNCVGVAPRTWRYRCKCKSVIMPVFGSEYL